MGEKLRAIRHERSEFDARFFERDARFAPIKRAASVFADLSDWPKVVDYGKAFRREEEGCPPPPVRFEEAPLKRKRPPGLVVRDDLYDATIVKRGIVKTRARMWHDYLNALVWATFPKAKLALHRRQHRAIEKWLPEGATELPNARTRELDALALIDEGGVLIVEGVDDEGVATTTTILFGHALFEGLVFEQPAMVARAVALDARAKRTELGQLGQQQPSDVLELCDMLLAERLDDTTRIVSPDELSRLPI